MIEFLSYCTKAHVLYAIACDKILYNFFIFYFIISYNPNMCRNG